MNKFNSFVIKESKHIFRDKRLMLILFGMPVVMMLLFGFAITTDVKNVRAVVVTSSIDHLTQRKVQQLSMSEYFNIVQTVSTPAEAEKLICGQKADIALVFSADYASKKDGIQIIVDASDPNMAQQWANYATNILVEVPSQGVNVKMLMKSAYNFVPAIMGMLLMLICAMMTSISIVKEKEKGTMEVLLVSPVRPIVIILAKVVPYLIVAFGILAVILLMSKFVLGIPIQGALMWIILISVIYILLALSLGMLISNVAKTQFVALIMSVMMLLMPIVMLSGMLFPVESMPKVLQWISAVIPTRYYIDAMRKLMIMGVGIGEVMRETLILGAMTVGLIVLSLTKFKNRLE